MQATIRGNRQVEWSWTPTTSRSGFGSATGSSSHGKVVSPATGGHTPLHSTTSGSSSCLQSGTARSSSAGRCATARGPASTRPTRCCGRQSASCARSGRLVQGSPLHRQGLEARLRVDRALRAPRAAIARAAGDRPICGRGREPADARAQKLVSELRRRSVFRVAGGYLLGMWIMLQVAEVTFEPLRLRSGG